MTQTPETQPENAPTPAGDDSAVARRRWLKSLTSSMRSPRKAYNTIYTFMNELSRDHTFWLHMMAVRSGAAMTVLSCAGAIAYAMTLPFSLAATVITGAALLGGAATVAIIAGTRTILGRMRAAYDSMVKGETANPSVPPPPVPAASDRPFYRFVNKIGESKIVKAAGETQIWKVSARFINEQKRWMLGGTALSGAALTTGMSAWVLAAQVAVVPVVAVGSAISFVALWAAVGVISGCMGLYFGTKSLLRWGRVIRAEKEAARGVDAALQPAPDASATPALDNATAKEDFTAAVKPAAQQQAVTANDNATDAPKKSAAPKK